MGGKSRKSTSSFLRRTLKLVSNVDHPLHFLVVRKKGGGFKWRTVTFISKKGNKVTGRYPTYLSHYKISGPTMQVGHPTAKASGAVEVHTAEDSDLNKRDGELIESKGAFSRKPYVMIEGVPVDLKSAKIWVRDGLLDAEDLKKGTIVMPPEINSTPKGTSSRNTTNKSTRTDLDSQRATSSKGTQKAEPKNSKGDKARETPKTEPDNPKGDKTRRGHEKGSKISKGDKTRETPKTEPDNPKGDKARRGRGKEPENPKFTGKAGNKSLSRSLKSAKKVNRKLRFMSTEAVITKRMTSSSNKGIVSDVGKTAAPTSMSIKPKLGSAVARSTFRLGKGFLVDQLMEYVIGKIVSHFENQVRDEVKRSISFAWDQSVGPRIQSVVNSAIEWSLKAPKDRGKIVPYILGTPRQAYVKVEWSIMLKEFRNDPVGDTGVWIVKWFAGDPGFVEGFHSVIIKDARVWTKGNGNEAARDRQMGSRYEYPKGSGVNKYDYVQFILVHDLEVLSQSKKLRESVSLVRKSFDKSLSKREASIVGTYTPPIELIDTVHKALDRNELASASRALSRLAKELNLSTGSRDLATLRDNMFKRAKSHGTSYSKLNDKQRNLFWSYLDVPTIGSFFQFIRAFGGESGKRKYRYLPL
jgi:hypothetical protein